MSDVTQNSHLEERILEVAKSVFMEKGYTDTSMSEIAERVGINRPGLHYYFRTKDKMFNAVFGMIIESIIPKFQDIMLHQEVPIARRIEELVNAYYSMLQENPNLPLFIMREISRDADFLIRTFSLLNIGPFFGKLRQSLLEEMAEGKLQQVPLRVVFLTFYSALIFPFLSRNLISRTMMEADETFEDLLVQWKPYVIHQMVNLLSVKK